MVEDRIYLEVMAAELHRAPHTIRQWLREKEREPANRDNLPDELVPHREGGRAKIFWTASQLEGMRAFAAARERRRGWQAAS